MSQLDGPYGMPSDARPDQTALPSDERFGRAPMPAETESGLVPVSGLPEPDLDGPVTLEDREGVFAHMFKCRRCRLEFTVYSWLPTRHRVGTVCCPECGVPGPMLHRRWTISTSAFFSLAGAREIFGNSCPRDADIMDDSSW